VLYGVFEQQHAPILFQYSFKIFYISPLFSFNFLSRYFTYCPIWLLFLRTFVLYTHFELGESARARARARERENENESERERDLLAIASSPTYESRCPAPTITPFCFGRPTTLGKIHWPHTHTQTNIQNAHAHAHLVHCLWVRS
jgi:hypothetical protein